MSDSISAPCPWCEGGGNPHLLYCKETFFSFTVRCEECKAQGPRIKLNIEEYQMGRKSWDDFSTPIKRKAVESWNSWAKLWELDE